MAGEHEIGLTVKNLPSSPGLSTVCVSVQRVEAQARFVLAGQWLVAAPINPEGLCTLAVL